MEPHVVETEVGALPVRVHGEGPVAVLWHSLFVDGRSWDRVADGLAADRRLLLVTGPGHGGSRDRGRRYTLEDCAAAAATVLDAMGVAAPVDWVGNAWGGHVGIVFAASRPERCRTLVTLGTPVQALNRPERARTMLLLAAYRALGHTRLVDDGVVSVLLSAHTRAHDLRAVQLVEECLASADPTALRNAVVSISLHRPDLSDRLPEVRVPTLFVTGTEHKGWTPQQAEAATRLLADGSAVAVPDSAYLTPLEAPAATTALVREFWAHASTATR